MASEEDEEVAESIPIRRLASQSLSLLGDKPSSTRVALYTRGPAAHMGPTKVKD